METNIKIKKLHSNRVMVKLNQLVDIIAQLTLLWLTKELRSEYVSITVFTVKSMKKRSTLRPTTWTCPERGPIFVSNIIIGNFTRTSHMQFYTVYLGQLHFICSPRIVNCENTTRIVDHCWNDEQLSRCYQHESRGTGDKAGPGGETWWGGHPDRCHHHRSQCWASPRRLCVAC